MANPLVSYLNSNVALAVYQKIQRDIPAHIIFDAMAQVSQRRGQNFPLPASPVEYQQKHNEIKNFFANNFMRALDRRSFFLELIEEIHLQLNLQNEAQHIDQLLADTVVVGGSDNKYKLSQLGAWALEWDVVLEIDDRKEQRNLVALLYATNRGQLFHQKYYSTLRVVYICTIKKYTLLH